MHTNPITLLACTPVSLAPHHDREHPDYAYHQVECPECRQPMWLGAKIKEAHERNPHIPLCCSFCAIFNHGVGETTHNITPLREGGAP